MPKTTTNSGSNRKTAIEKKATLWAFQHPGFALATPSMATTAALAPVPTAVAAVTVAGAVTAWWRYHPSSFDCTLRPVLRSFRRRWMSWTYLGPSWRSTMIDCGLSREHNGETAIPRIIRVRAHSPHVETVKIKLVKGQCKKDFEDAAERLAVAMDAQRVGVEKIGNRTLALIVQRDEPFDRPVLLSPLTSDVESVDTSRVVIGRTEYDNDWTLNVASQHILVAGASGSGKNSITWSALWGLAPLIRAGLVRPWMCDPKQTELVAAKPMAHRYATDGSDCVTLISDFRDELLRKQEIHAENGWRSHHMSTDHPMDILVIDEIGALLGYNRDIQRQIGSDLAIIASQGRATGNLMWAFVQEPSKDVLPIRDLFTMKICLRVTSAVHVDMTLGDGARMKGALADEIPNVPDTAGIGFVVRPRTGSPMRVRAAYADDVDIKELVNYCTPETDDEQPKLHLVA